MAIASGGVSRRTMPGCDADFGDGRPLCVCRTFAASPHVHRMPPHVRRMLADIATLAKREAVVYEGVDLKRIRRIVRALDPKAYVKMSRRERLEALRIRRVTAVALILFLVVAMMTLCSVHAMSVRMPSRTQTTAQAGKPTSGVKGDGGKPYGKTRRASEKQEKQSSEKQSAGKQRSEGETQEESAVDKALRAQSAALSDEDKSRILDQAQKTAQNSGNPVIRYHYCVTTKGDVGSVDDFANAAFRILNDEHGWPRAGAVFERSTDGDCDFDLVLSQASEMPSFSPSCSVEYSCRVDQNVIINDDRWKGAVRSWLDAGGDLARYRVMVINHEVGHRLGHIDNETTCAGEGQLAPLMQEQSMHLDGCKVNEYPLDSELWIG